MRVLIACEYSGRVREAFRKLGHDAWSCDLLPADDNSPFHYQGDVLSILNEGWDLMIAHPPCTFLCNSGVRWLYNKDGSFNPERLMEMRSASLFFRKLLDSKIPRIAIENPIMHRHGGRLMGIRGPDQTVQPWMFGHAESKATCLWLKNLPPLKETENVQAQFKALPKKEAQKIHYMSPGKDRWKLRSVTYQGIADAMASQWGGLAADATGRPMKNVEFECGIFCEEKVKPEKKITITRADLEAAIRRVDSIYDIADDLFGGV